MASFGDIVAALRRRAGMTQAQLGARLELSQGAVSLVEAGTSDVGMTAIAKYAEALGVSVETLCALISACSRGESAEDAVKRHTIRAA